MIVQCEATSKIMGNTYEAWSNALAKLVTIPRTASIVLHNSDYGERTLIASWTETRQDDRK